MQSELLVLKDDEAFIPTDDRGNGLILQTHELQINGRALVCVNQYQAIRTAQKLGWDVMSSAEYNYTYSYAREHQEDERLRRYYESLTSKMKFARFNKTQVHNLNGNTSLVVNVSKVHDEFDLAMGYEKEIIPVSWLPKKDGYIQEFDERTGLPKSVGQTPVPELSNSYFYIDPKINTLAVIRNRGSGLDLNLDWTPANFNDVLGVSVAKKFTAERLEEKF